MLLQDCFWLKSLFSSEVNYHVLIIWSARIEVSKYLRQYAGHIQLIDRPCQGRQFSDQKECRSAVFLLFTDLLTGDRFPAISNPSFVLIITFNAVLLLSERLSELMRMRTTEQPPAYSSSNCANCERSRTFLHFNNHYCRIRDINTNFYNCSSNQDMSRLHL